MDFRQPDPDAPDDRIEPGSPRPNLASIARPQDRTAPLKAAALVVAAAMLLGVGLLGRFATVVGGPAASSATVARASARPSPSPVVAATPDVPDRSLRKTILPQAGYEVQLTVAAAQAPIVYDA